MRKSIAARRDTSLVIAQQLSRPEDRAAMIKVAALWMERAEEAEQRERIVQQNSSLRRNRRT
jgi:hypothetical protein